MNILMQLFIIVCCLSVIYFTYDEYMKGQKTRNRFLFILILEILCIMLTIFTIILEFSKGI